MTPSVCLTIASALLAAVANTPDAAGAIIGNVKISMKANRDTYRPSPHLAILGDETCQKVLVTAVRLAITNRDAYDVVTGSNSAVPRAVLGCECVAVILLGEFPAAGIEGHLEGSHVGLDDNVRSNDFRGKTDSLTVFCLLGSERCCLGIGPRTVHTWFRESWILVATHVIPRPAIKTPFLNRCNVVRNQVIAQVVPFVD